MHLEKALFAEDAGVVVDILVATAGGSISRFEEALPIALAGGFSAVLVVTANWDSLLDEALRAAASAVPGAVETTAGHIVKIHGRAVEWLSSSLRVAVADAPFSSFVGAFGPGRGMAIACLAKVREAIPDLPTLSLPRSEPPDFAPPVDVLRFHRLVGLAIRGLAPPLERLQEALGLSNAELGDLFGVSRQAIDQWKTRGIPPDRRAKVGDLLGAIDLLARKLKPGRLALVARRPATAFGGRSLLELAAADEHAELREGVERAFDWSTTA
jgi:hypothetical protein